MAGWTDVGHWLDHVERERGVDDRTTAEAIVAWCDERDLKNRGQGNDSDSKGIVYTPVVPGVAWDPVPFHVTGKTGRVGLEGSSIGAKGRRPYGNDDSFGRLIDKLHAIPGIAQHKGTYPDLSLGDLADPSRFQEFFDLMDSVVRGVRRANT